MDEPQRHDLLYPSAVDIVMKHNRASISLVQRHLKIGYNRAAVMIEDMEKEGLIAVNGKFTYKILRRPNE